MSKVKPNWGILGGGDAPSTASTKVCRTCGVKKALDAFGKQAGRYLGVGGQCKPCRSAYLRSRRADPNVRRSEIAASKAWAAANPERARDIKHASIARNRNTLNASRRARRAADVDAAREKERAWRDSKRDAINADRRARRAALPAGESKARRDQNAARMRAARAANPEKFRAQDAAKRARKNGGAK